jgi:competence protein ComEA
VDVVGAVRRAGVYRLPQGSRIADAVARAGGATRKADLALVNLAAPLADGTQIVVPLRAAATHAAAGDPASSVGPVHLNTATAADLDALPGVGPVTAQKILDYRQQHGAFGNVDELDAIPGIGPKRLDQLRELVAP